MQKIFSGGSVTLGCGDVRSGRNARYVFAPFLFKINGMDWLYSLFVGGGIAHTVFTLALVITAGILLGKVKVCGISLGITWILFVGIIAAHFGMGIPAEVRHFIQEFGLILFVFSIGMQVGPGFFASFKHGGLTLVCLASTIVLLGVAWRT